MLQKGIKEMMLVIGNKQRFFSELFGIFADFAGFARPENDIDGIIYIEILHENSSFL